MRRGTVLLVGAAWVLLTLGVPLRRAAALCTTDTTVGDFAAGDVGSCYPSETADGEVTLSPTAGAEFSGVALPPDWGSFTWDPGGTVVLGGGSVTVDAALVRTDSNDGPGRSLEFVATFGVEPFQHIGFGNIADSGGNQTYGGPPWAMFSTGGPGLTTLLARVANGGPQVNVPVGAVCSNGTCFGETHRYRIDWSATQIEFFIDGVSVHTEIAQAITVNMRPAISDFAPGGPNLSVDWLRMTPYASPCAFLSRLFDAGNAGGDWTTLTPALLTPAGTSVTIETRSGNTTPVDGTWSAFQPLAGLAIQSPNARYLQYRATLATTDASLTPALDESEVCVDPCLPTGPETCDGLDNDCNGQIDDDDPGGGVSCDTGQLGVCTAGLTECQSPTLVCVQQTPSSPETCNTLDDDCDGQSDEGDPGGGGACSTGNPGICAAGINHCLSGTISCVQSNAPTAESCNTLDDDCDGQSDEGDPGGGGACNTGTPGICAAGILHCQGGSLACAQTNTPTIESCNGLDDNCNGSTDEPFVDLGSSCTVAIGACAQSGVRVCRVDGTGTICNATAGSPSPEACDGIDNDCDGLVDEGNPGAGGACSTGQAGVCDPGTFMCQGGGLVCGRNSQPTAEACNGVDDDCDAQTDEGDPGGGGACSTGLPGACAAGTRHCVDSHIVCQPNLSSNPETCNDADDDCDGQVDEGNPGGGGACSTGQIGACDAGALQCQSGALACVASSGPTSELCFGDVDEDCDGDTDEIAACVLCLPASTVATAVQTKKTKVKLTTSPDRDKVQHDGTFVLPVPNAIAPDVEDVTLRVHDGAGFYYQATIPAGTFVRSSSNRRFTFSDPTLAFGGVRKAKFSIASDRLVVKYSIKAQGLNEPPFAAGTSTATVQVGPRCFTDTGDACVLSSSSGSASCK